MEKEDEGGGDAAVTEQTRLLSRTPAPVYLDVRSDETSPRRPDSGEFLSVAEDVEQGHGEPRGVSPPRGAGSKLLAHARRLHAWLEGRATELRWGARAAALTACVALLVFLVVQNHQRLASLLGVAAFVGVGVLASNNRKSIPWHTVAWGLGLQLSFGVLILYTEVGYLIFKWLGDGAAHFLSYSDAGAVFVFGTNFEDHYIAFKVLPTIIFFSSFISVLYFLGVVQIVVKAVAWIMVKTLDTSGAESLSCSANIFVGQTEAPLVIKPFIALLTQSELHSVMTSGFATVAGGVMVAYMSFGINPVHLISASVMSAPAALAMSKIIYPETDNPITQGTVQAKFTPQKEVNVIDAAAAGALSGGRLACNVLCILISFLALIALVNGILGALGSLVYLPQLSIEWLLGWMMAPVAWLLGVPWEDCIEVGVLLGKKTVLNEFVAYLDLRDMVAQHRIGERAEIIATYALCGFSNFASMGVQIGGIGGICPERQQDLARLSLSAYPKPAYI